LGRVPKGSAHWLPGGVPTDASRDEALRQIGAEILDEPVPKRLLQALHGQEDVLSMALRHVRGGEVLVARQRALAERLSRDGRDVRLAEELLSVMEVSLAQHRNHLAQLIGGL
jgi:hypothetical protein